MLLSNLFIAKSSENRIAWASLQRFHNVSAVADRLLELHGLDKSQMQNVLKQARQLRFCLMQAREYFLASRVVSLATKPTLLYYSAMSLALAEILVKQSGDSSLDRARAQHAHHGLLFSDRRTGKLAVDLKNSAAGLLARPMVQGAEHARMGTFELWHRSAREAPYVGVHTTHIAGAGTTQTQSILSMPEDKRMTPLREEGITLLDCFRHIPDMADFVEQHGIESNCVRGRIEHDKYDSPARELLRFTIHPNARASDALDAVMVHPALVDSVNLVPYPSGGTIRLETNPASPNGGLRFPPAATKNVKEFYCWLGDDVSLNEFGYLYVALYIAGNYARYYPDRWIADVESATDLALAIEELVAIAEQRMPWLTLSELSRSYHLFDG
jgi:hypothetical protein